MNSKHNDGGGDDVESGRGDDGDMVKQRYVE